MSQALVAVCAGFELSVRITILKYTQYRRQRGVQLCPAPHLKSVPPHFMFGPPLLHTSNIVFKNVASLLVFGPLLRKTELSSRYALLDKQCICLQRSIQLVLCIPAANCAKR